MRLLTEEAMNAIDPGALSADNIDPQALADPSAGPSLRAYLLLTQRAEEFTTARLVLRRGILE